MDLFVSLFSSDIKLITIVISLHSNCRRGCEYGYKPGNEDKYKLCTCEKCTGTDACDGVSDETMSRIGCGSCHGRKACAGLFTTTGVTIDVDSCNGPMACYKAVGELKTVLFSELLTEIFLPPASLSFHSQCGLQQLVSFVFMECFECWCDEIFITYIVNTSAITMAVIATISGAMMYHLMYGE